MAIKRSLGWIPDLPDQRDFKLAVSNVALPSAVDLRPLMPPVYDQLALGSCTANAIAAAVEFERAKQKLPHITPSRLFIYYNERVLEDSVDSDSGATLRDGMKAISDPGVCSESDWPYNIEKFAVKPPARDFKIAPFNRAISYLSVGQAVNPMRSCLASGYPFVFGMSVYDSFLSDEVARTGIVPMPGPQESLQGGHAPLGVGYDDSRRLFLGRNSWGVSWGIKGYFWIPYEYLTNADLADDFWTLRSVL